MSNIFVCVRCRPLNSREKTRGAVGLIRMTGNQTIIDRPPPGKDEKAGMSKEDNQPKTFAFDRSYWSACSPSDPDYASQQLVFQDIGQSMLNHAFGGYNTCIFAYGQTGSGKSYSMVGYGEDKGIIPLTCMELFERIDKNDDINLSYNVEVSYMEIYCERVRDLLNPKGQNNLRVREHPTFGPYVEDLSKMVVKSYLDIENLMDEGNKARTVASTNMNATSSRSHAVFTIILTQSRFDPDAQLSTEKVSRVSLVDLAGSERANSTGASGQRLKEGANINKSLTTLGKVISALADQAAAGGPSKKGSKKKEDVFIPYRDSVLTWLLKDSLGGNSKTIMLAAISPADYEETLSTLRYADRAKRIVNKAVVNEDPNAKIVRELNEELALLRSKLAVYDPVEAYANVKDANGNIKAVSGPNKVLPYPGNVTQSAEEIQNQLQASEKLMSQLTETWEQKLEKTKSIQVEREKALEELGITIEKNDVGVHSPKRTPHLVNLNEDPFMSECLIYSLKLGITRVGLIGSEVEADIRLSGTNILEKHCHFENVNSVVTLHPVPESMTLVNGRPVTEPKRLRSGYRIILGDCHVFRFTNPEEVRRERTKSRLSLSRNGSDVVEPQSPPQERPESRNSTVASDIVDWSFAWREVALSGSVDFSTSDAGEFSPRVRPFSASGFADSGFPQSPSPDRQDLETRLKATQDEMERALVEQRLQYEASFKQFVESRGESEVIIPRVFTEREKYLIDLVLTCLRKRTFVGMAESVLTNAVVLKEANIISRELRKDITYQFIVIDSLTTSIASSFWESASAFDELDSSEDIALVEARVPCVGIQVIDKRNISIYTWSIDKLKQKLSMMRNLYNFMDRPMYREHFNLEDPFYEKPAPQFAMVGISVVSLRNLFWNCAQKFFVPVLNQSNGQPEAQLSVSIVPIAITSPPNRDLSPAQKTSLNIGDQIVFEIIIEELSGLDETRFTQAHVQFRLSSFGHSAPLLAGEKLFATDPVSDFGKEPIRFNYRHTLSINITETNFDYLMSQPLQFEVFGKPSLKALSSYEFNEDEVVPGNEHAHAVLIGAPENHNSIRERRHEDELLQREFHDVLAWIHITELAPSGEYVKAPVQAVSATDSGCFLLRQGVQRRINIHMTHSSGRAFPWHAIPKVVLGRVRLVDNKGRYTNENSTASGAITLTVIASSLITDVSSDGTGSLQFSVAWDSSLHDSVHLNRNTPSGQRVVLTLNWQVESERVIEPLIFTADLPVSITSRTGSVSKSLFSFMANSTRQLSKISCLYQVTLKPRMTKKRSELWRLNTASTYVRGEEFLRGWKPRGVSLILDARKATQVRQRREALELARQNTQLDILRGIHFLSSDVPSEEKAQELLSKYTQVWQSLVANKDEIDLVSQGHLTSQPGEQSDSSKPIGSTTTLANDVLSPDSVSVGSDTTASSAPEFSSSTAPSHQTGAGRRPDSGPKKMVGEVKPIPKSDNIARKGFLLVPEDADNWVRRWFVIRRPYMFMYADNYETEELGAFDLSTVRVDYNKDMESLLQRNNVFALYTSNNAYMLQASNLEDMKAWLKSIDQWFSFPV